MPYMNLDLDYFDHPKVVRLVGQLGRGADLLPVRLWCYCGKYHADSGELIGYSPLEIETAIKWWGPAGKAVGALLSPFMGKPGFLEKMENGYKVHDWDEVNGHISAFKKRAQAGAKAKWDRVRADAQAMLKQSISNATSNALQIDSQEEISLGDREEGAGEGKGSANPQATFDEARRAFPGTKRGLAVEWLNFTKKHPAYREIVPLLIPAIRREEAHKSALKSAKQFCPGWKNLQTWLNQSCWTQEFPTVEESHGQAGSNGRSGGFESTAQRDERAVKDLNRRIREAVGTAGAHHREADPGLLSLDGPGNPEG